MEKRLGRGLTIFIAAILLLAFLFPYEPEVSDLDDLSFHTTGESRLFFNNTRAFYYSFKELEKAGITVYEFGGTDKTESKSNINFFIVQNWRNNEAYIMSKPSALFNDSVLTIANQTLAYPIDRMNNEDHYKLAAKLFRKAMNNTIETRDLDAIFGGAENTKANLTVLKDYFRLIGKYH